MKLVLAFVSMVLASPLLAQSRLPAGAAISNPPASPIATEVAAKLFPNGTYRRMLGPQFSKMMSGMADGIGTMPLGPILKAAGLPEADAAKLDKATLGEIMAILDPVYKERTRRTTDAIFGAMVPMFEQLEPDLRDGLALSLDHKFSSAQLGELRTFFSTPTGNMYASQQMLLFTDSAVMGKMQAAMPKMMQSMPQLVEAAIKSTADLPKAKSYSDLTPAERDKLARMLGVDPSSLKK